MHKEINPKVTIYITNYNYGKFISKAIDSVIKQTFKKIEILIIDDGSTDNSKKIINNYTRKYPFINSPDLIQFQAPSYSGTCLVYLSTYRISCPLILF